jgi:hypothetical protein
VANKKCKRIFEFGGHGSIRMRGFLNIKRITGGEGCFTRIGSGWQQARKSGWKFFLRWQIVMV